MPAAKPSAACSAARAAPPRGRNDQRAPGTRAGRRAPDAGMTVTDAPLSPAPGGGGNVPQSGGPAAAPMWLSGRQGTSQPKRTREVAGTMLWILALCLIGFALWFVVFSRLYYDRAQADAYANFRSTLEQAVAPTGPTQPFNPAQLLTLGTPVAVLTIPEIGLH